MTVRWLTAFLDRPAATIDAATAFWRTVTGSTLSTPRGEHRQFATLLPPDGDAYLRVLPDLELYQGDGHPTDAGSYLAACVVLRAVYGAVGPNGFTGGVDDRTAQQLQGAAASR